MQHRERTLLSWQKILMYSVVPKSKLIVIKGKMHLSESPLQPCPISQMDPLHLSNVLLFEENSAKMDVSHNNVYIFVLI